MCSPVPFFLTEATHVFMPDQKKQKGPLRNNSLVCTFLSYCQGPCADIFISETTAVNCPEHCFPTTQCAESSVDENANRTSDVLLFLLLLFTKNNCSHSPRDAIRNAHPTKTRDGFLKLSNVMKKQQQRVYTYLISPSSSSS